MLYDFGKLEPSNLKGPMCSRLFKRFIHRKISPLKPLNAVKRIVLTTKIEQHCSEVPPTSPKRTQRKTTIKGSSSKTVTRLNRIYNQNYTEPTAAELNSVNHFFNVADIKYEWSAGRFIDVPGEKLKEKYGNDLQVRNVDSTKKFPGRTYIPFELVNGLPEVAFLGKSNAGKSTLLNNLTTDLKRSSLNLFARASKWAGFTKTLNSFNVGNRFRVIDTPGYGFNSKSEQGDLTLAYLKGRKELVRCFLLIPGEQGFSDWDLQLMEFMQEHGVPFEIVFTKMDKVKNFDVFEQMIEDNKKLLETSLSRLIFTNSIPFKLDNKRYGIDLLRFIIFESCGLKPGVKPSRKKV